MRRRLLLVALASTSAAAAMQPNFSGIFSALSFEIGRIDVTWQQPQLADPSNTTYELFVTEAPFPYENYTVYELRNLDSIETIETDELSASVEDLDPGVYYELLVVATVDDESSSTNMTSLQVRVANVTAEVREDVFILDDSYEIALGDTVDVDTDPTVSLLTWMTVSPAPEEEDIFVGSIVGGQALIDGNQEEDFLVEIKAIDGVGNFTVEFVSILAAFDALSLDGCFDSMRETNFVDESNDRRRLLDFDEVIADRTISITVGTKFEIGPSSFEATFSKSIRQYVRVVVDIGFFDVDMSVTATKEVTSTSEFKASIGGDFDLASINTRLWKGPVAKLKFFLFAIPVVIYVRPSLFIEGKINAGGSFSVTTKYEDTETETTMVVYDETLRTFGTTSTTESVTSPDSATPDFNAKVTLTADIGPKLVIDVLVYGVLGFDVNAAFKGVIEAENGDTTGIAQIFSLGKFDVSALLEVGAEAKFTLKDFRFLPDVDFSVGVVIYKQQYFFFQLPAFKQIPESMCPEFPQFVLTYEDDPEAYSALIPHPPQAPTKFFFDGVDEDEWDVEEEMLPEAIKLTLTRTSCDGLSPGDMVEFPTDLVDMRASPLVPAWDLVLLQQAKDTDFDPILIEGCCAPTSLPTESPTSMPTTAFPTPVPRPTSPYPQLSPTSSPTFTTPKPN